MLDSKSLENYHRWVLLHPLEANKMSFDKYGSCHSELLGYLRWCEQKRKRKEKSE